MASLSLPNKNQIAKLSRLFAALQQIEGKFPDLITPDSPTQGVGAEPREELLTAQHSAPLLSLDATREQKALERFDERVRKTAADGVHYILEEKFDGAVIELIHEKGVLRRAITRGDGFRGEDVTDHVGQGTRAARLRDRPTTARKWIARTFESEIEYAFSAPAT